MLSHIQYCDPRDYSPPGSSVYGIFQARILEWVAIAFSYVKTNILKKLQEKKVGVNLYDPGVGNGFLDMAYNTSIQRKSREIGLYQNQKLLCP